MKTYVSLLLMTFLVSLNVVIAATVIDGGGNDASLNLEYSLTNDTPSLRSRIEAVLLNGTWSPQSYMTVVGAQKTDLQFNANGTVDIFTANESGNLIYKSKLWQVTESKGDVFLTLTDAATQKSEIFKVKDTLRGVTLINLVNGKETRLDAIKNILSLEDADLMVADLVGYWENIIYPFDVNNGLGECGTTEPMKNAALKYDFLANGTYIKTISGDGKEVVEMGQWDMSRDGQFLKLRATNGGETQVAKIKNIDANRLTIEQSLITPDAATVFCTGFKAFDLRKVKVSATNL